MCTNFKTLPQKEILRTNHRANNLAIRFADIKCVKQFLKRLEAPSDQNRTRKAWSDHIAYSCLKKRHLICERKRLPVEFFTLPVCTPLILKVAQYVFLPVKVAEPRHSIEATEITG